LQLIQQYVLQYKKNPFLKYHEDFSYNKAQLGLG
jgi:hypothetical protein